jgi:hypothetical protein
VKVRVSNGRHPQEISLKACSDGKKIFFLLQYKTGSENRKHRAWHWDPVLRAYIPGKEQEETFSIVIARSSGGNKKADIWIWRAARTDPVNKADDLFYMEPGLVNQPDRTIIMDNGTICWFSKYFGNYAGLELPRFYNRAPEGSTGDVSAKGRWDLHQLSIEFSRLLDTGNSDDISLKPGIYYIKFFRGVPSPDMINATPFVPLVIK